MAWLKADYKSVKERYPDLVEQTIKKIRGGRSKHKNDAPSKFEWGFSWSLLIDDPGLTGRLSDLFDTIKRTGEPPKPREFATADEEVADYERRANVSLGARKGKTVWESKDRIEKLPKELVDMVRQNRNDAAAERERWAKLSPEEQDREQDEAIRALSRSSGFVGISIGPNGAEVLKGGALRASFSLQKSEPRQAPVGPNISGILSKIECAIGTTLPVKAAASASGTKYYWQRSRHGDEDVFLITPKEFFDAEGCLDDRHFEAYTDDIPEGFHSLMESTFEFRGNPDEGEKILRANPLFEEKEMFPE